jgi:hypothetical protein
MYDNNNPMNGQFSSTARYLSSKHLAEWCEGSAVNEAIARLSIESLTAKEFNERIRPKEPIKTGGWWCGGVNWRTGVFMGPWYGQGKPDKPHHPEGSDERKYLTGSGMEPDAIFLPMPDKNYWAKLHADKSIPRHWAEGVKKAGAGLSLGLAVLALTGVWNWGKDGKLAKFVGEWAQPETTHYIDFDSDYAAKPSCRAAIIKFAQLLIEHGCTVHITCWDIKFKGLDDLIVGKGGDAFLQAVADAPTFAEWEKSLGAGAKVLNHPKFEARELSGLKTDVRQLLEGNLKRSDLTIAIGTLSQKYGRPTQEIRSLYLELEEEIEQEAQKEDTKIGVEQLLASKAASVKLSDLFPESLAAPIEIVAKRMNLKPECYALALICGSSRFIKNGSSTMLVEEWNRYRCRTSGYFGALIAESAQMKTPVLNAIITDPLAAMRTRCKDKFEAEKKAYTEELERWRNSKEENKGPMPDAPVEKFAYITKATWEGIAGMVGRSPSQGILWLCDELAGFFSSQNQYRSGKGSDKEDLLEAWSGNGAVIARAAGTTVNVGAVSLSLYGNIQPKILAPLLGDGSDDNGTFARFDFVQQPPALTQITLGLPSIDITPMLQALYEKMDANPVMEFELDGEAKELFVDYYNHCQRLKFDHPKQGMRAMLGKVAEKVGRVATILHCIHAAHLGLELSNKIPVKQVAAAIKWVEYTTQQALSINLEVCSPDALESNLVRIISLAERKGGAVSAREVSKSFDSKYRPSAQKIQEWFTELATMNYGEVTSKGQSILFSLTKTSPSSPVGWKQDIAKVTGGDTNLPTVSPPSPLTNVSSRFTQSSGEEWGCSGDTNLPTFKSLPEKELRSSGEDGEVFTPPVETSQPLMLSCTTEPAEFTEQIRKAIKTFDRSLADQVWKALEGKAKKKLRNEVKNALTPDERQNFKLLAKAGFLRGTRVKYVGHSKYAEQYEGLELEVFSIDEYFEITCLKPDGAGYTTRLKPEELEPIS